MCWGHTSDSSTTPPHPPAGLQLDDNALQGTLPADWEQLTGLESLSLRNNGLTGELPAPWSSLASLYYL